MEFKKDDSCSIQKSSFRIHYLIRLFLFSPWQRVHFIIRLSFYLYFFSNIISIPCIKVKKENNKEKKIQKSSKWLVVCEGTQTEPNYFKSAVSAINEGLDDKYKLNVIVLCKGMNTISLVK